MNIADTLQKTAERLPDKIAYYFNDRGTTFKDLQDMSEACAFGLQESGVKKGDRAALFTFNSLEFIVAWFGLVKLGAIVIPVNVMLKGRESKYIMENAEVNALIVHRNQVEMVNGFRFDLPFLKNIFVIGGGPEDGMATFADICSARAPRDVTVNCAPDDVATMIYTSGTTGFPKGAMLTHGNLYSNVRGIVTVLDLREETVRVSVTPFFHAMGLTVNILAMMMLGATTVIQAKLDFEEFLKANEKYKATAISGAPALHYMLTSDPSTERYDLSSWKIAMSGSAPLPAEVLKKFETKFGIPMVEAYGLTEVTTLATANPYGGVRKPGSVGIPLAELEVKIFDDQDRPLPTGEIGEIVIRGPAVMKGYYNNPEATAETLKEGWLHTGDVGYLDEDGYLYIVDRKKDLIICSGYNVYPREIEELLYTHPAVSEAAVIGVPDPKRGEIPMAFVVVRAGRHVGEEDLIQFCKDNLASYKLIKAVRFIDALPRNPNQKILKRELRKMAQAA